MDSICGYHKDKLLGEGQYGHVYSIEYYQGELVAFKVPKYDKGIGYAESDVTEIDVMCRLSHPNLIEALGLVDPRDCAQLYGGIGIMMPIISYTLGKMVTSISYSFNDSFNLVWQLLCGISFLHENEFIAIDLSNSNIFVTERNDGYLLQVGDYGLGIYLGEEKTVVSRRERSTYSVRAPEAIGGMYSKANDLWSVGILALEIFTRRHYPYDWVDDRNIDWDTITTKIFGSNDEDIDDTLKKMLSRVPPKYRERSFAIIRDLLRFQPARRKKATEMLRDHFPEETPPTGFVADPEGEVYDRSLMTRSVGAINQMLRRAGNVANRYTLLMLFLSYQMLMKTAGNIVESDPFVLGVTVLYMAGKLYGFEYLPLALLVDNTPGNESEATVRIMKAQSDVIIAHEGMLNVERIYHTSSTLGELTTRYYTELLASTPSKIEDDTPVGEVTVSDFLSFLLTL